MADSVLNEAEEDHYLQDFFPKSVPYNLQHLIAYRIMLLAKTDTIIGPGETHMINSSCLKKGKLRRNLSMFLTPYETLPLSFESGGYIDQNYTGRVMIKLKNYSLKSIKLSAGTPIGYIAMQQYSM